MHEDGGETHLRGLGDLKWQNEQPWSSLISLSDDPRISDSIPTRIKVLQRAEVFPKFVISRDRVDGFGVTTMNEWARWMTKERGDCPPLFSYLSYIFLFYSIWINFFSFTPVFGSFIPQRITFNYPQLIWGNFFYLCFRKWKSTGRRLRAISRSRTPVVSNELILVLGFLRLSIFCNYLTSTSLHIYLY